MADEAIAAMQPYAAGSHLSRLTQMQPGGAPLASEAGHAWLAAGQRHKAALRFVWAVLDDPHVDLSRPAWLDAIPDDRP